MPSVWQVVRTETDANSTASDLRQSSELPVQVLRQRDNLCAEAAATRAVATRVPEQSLLRLSAVRDNVAMSDPSKRKRRWFQFSLRTLFVIVATLAVQCAVCLPKLRERQEYNNISAAERFLGTMELLRPLPDIPDDGPMVYPAPGHQRAFPPLAPKASD
jgi:hypothetical protein